MRFDNERSFEVNFELTEFLPVVRNKAFERVAIEFLSDLSSSLLNNKDAKQYPDLITFAFFCRPSNLKTFFRKNYSTQDKLRVGWGLCVHIAPANIPMNFAFSFVMGFLAGNSNVVRLPSKHFAQIDLFLSAFNDVINSKLYTELQKNNVFIRTARNSMKLKELVCNADALVVWGGDETVEKFRDYPKKPTCKEHYFPNRLSSVVLNYDELLKIDDKEIMKLVERFYNDTYLVDQAACSSPSMIIWYGKSNDLPTAKRLFLNVLEQYLLNKYEFNTAKLLQKNSDVMEHCKVANSKLEIDKVSNEFWFIKTDQYKSLKPRLGTFIEKRVDCLSQLPSLLRENEQTITYWGVDAEELASNLLEQGTLFVERIVPVGEALNIGLVWDGKNMVNELSRQVQVS